MFGTSQCSAIIHAVANGKLPVGGNQLDDGNGINVDRRLTPLTFGR